MRVSGIHSALNNYNPVFLIFRDVKRKIGKVVYIISYYNSEQNERHNEQQFSSLKVGKRLNFSKLYFWLRKYMNLTLVSLRFSLIFNESFFIFISLLSILDTLSTNLFKVSF